jgi:signal transduction histidine kinase
LYRTGVLVEQAKGLRPDGSVFDAHVSAAVIRDEAGSPVGMVGSFLDITGQKQREQEDLRHREQLRSLAAALSLAEDRERRRMAVALHDDVAQALALVKLKTDLLRQSGAAAAVATDLEQVSGLLDEASRSMWSAIFDLAPPALYEMGLGAALERLIVRVAEQYPETRFGFEADGAPEHLGEDTRAALFRSAREALVNVARHAKARNAKVSMQSTDGHVQVRIEDDGVGFDVARALSHVGTREGFGLVSIRERLTYLGGGLGIKSEPGRGTQVVLTVLQSADGGAGREAPRSP